MQEFEQTSLVTICEEEIGRVCGGGIGGLPAIEVRAQDMYGNTLSVEEWMDRQLSGTANPHDFYEPGFNSHRPNIY